MNIVLGSNSEKELNTLQKTLDGKLPMWRLERVEVGADSTNLLLKEEEITKKAVIRAKEALKFRPHTNLAIGLEVGLEDKSGIYWMVGVAAFWDGNRLITGRSGGLPLPQTVSDAVKKGAELGQLLKDYSPSTESHESERINQLISRESSLVSAINSALTQFKQRTGGGSLRTIASLFTSDEGPSLLLKYSAVCFGLFFGLRAVTALTSPILGLLQILQPWFYFTTFYTALTILLIPGFVLLIVGLWRLASSLTIRQDHSLSLLAKITAATYVPSLLLWIMIITPALASNPTAARNIMNVWNDVFIVSIIISASCVAIAQWLLLRKLRVAMRTARPVWIGFATVYIVGWFIMQQIDGPHPYISILYAIGISWSVGLWRLSQDIGSYNEPKPAVDIAAVFDRA